MTPGGKKIRIWRTTRYVCLNCSSTLFGQNRGCSFTYKLYLLQITQERGNLGSDPPALLWVVAVVAVGL